MKKWTIVSIALTVLVIAPLTASAAGARRSLSRRQKYLPGRNEQSPVNGCVG